jgi:uncharacterized protein (DUF488 family)
VPRIWTIGYERLRPESLVAELEAAGVERVIDVRYRPQSRRPGMSKTRLGERLADSRIVYEHRRALGTPADLRWLFKAGRVEEGRAAYREHVEAHAADDLDALAAELDDAPPRRCCASRPTLRSATAGSSWRRWPAAAPTSRSSTSSR